MDSDPHDMHFSAPVLIWPERDSVQMPERRAQVEKMLAAFTDLPPLDQAHLLRALDQTQLRTLETKSAPWGKPVAAESYYLWQMLPTGHAGIARWLFVEPHGVFEDTYFDGGMREAVRLFVSEKRVDLQYDEAAKAYRVFGGRALWFSRENVSVQLNNPRRRSVSPSFRLESALIEKEPVW